MYYVYHCLNSEFVFGIPIENFIFSVKLKTAQEPRLKTEKFDQY
jgi:hypothetical protein